MADPNSNGHPDHYNRRLYPGFCPPTDSNDQCGIHSNAGIQNKAFYLLAEGGTHPYSGFSVSGVGRDAAGRIFFTALRSYLPGKPAASLHAVRKATDSGCSLHYGFYNSICNSVRNAWQAVGVPENIIDESWFFTRRQYLDFLLKEPDHGGWSFWANQINGSCHPSDQGCITWRRVMVSRAFWDSGDFQNRADVRGSGLVNPPGSARPYDNRQFVRWCYKIYLQREPDQGGWDFWTNDLNGHGDYNITINAFLQSGGYRYRFITED